MSSLWTSMNFHKRTHDVVAGRITQYRTAVGEPRQVKRSGPRGTERTGASAVRWRQPAAPKVGKVFVVQSEKRNDRGVVVLELVHATVTDVRREWLGHVTFADAKRMDYRTTDDFKVAWTRSADRIPPIVERWAVRELGEDGLRAELLARFERRHAATEVWVVSFQISEGRDRFLAAGSRGGDYTSTPARALDTDAPCVDDLDLARFAKKAEAHAEQQRASFRRDLEVGRAAQRTQKTDGLSNRALRHINDAADRRAA